MPSHYPGSPIETRRWWLPWAGLAPVPEFALGLIIYIYLLSFVRTLAFCQRSHGHGRESWRGSQGSHSGQ
ncbi:hypothetical protein DCJDKEDG_00074 [bovine alphaherpesvirus 1]|nr:hypothetical protein DCJDKEDG_00061 [Bovine alphaherpesvirus 1]AVM39520.1 hypothetical protein DCJDKEDG_00074 [Bovine alphaherpesvirus 1]